MSIAQLDQTMSSMEYKSADWAGAPWLAFAFFLHVTSVFVAAATISVPLLALVQEMMIAGFSDFTEGRLQSTATLVWERTVDRARAYADVLLGAGAPVSLKPVAPDASSILAGHHVIPDSDSLLAGHAILPPGFVCKKQRARKPAQIVPAPCEPRAVKPAAEKTKATPSVGLRPNPCEPKRVPAPKQTAKAKGPVTTGHNVKTMALAHSLAQRVPVPGYDDPSRHVTFHLPEVEQRLLAARNTWMPSRMSADQGIIPVPPPRVPHPRMPHPRMPHHMPMTGMPPPPMHRPESAWNPAWHPGMEYGMEWPRPQHPRERVLSSDMVKWTPQDWQPLPPAGDVPQHLSSHKPNPHAEHKPNPHAEPFVPRPRKEPQQGAEPASEWQWQWMMDATEAGEVSPKASHWAGEKCPSWADPNATNFVTQFDFSKQPEIAKKWGMEERIPVAPPGLPVAPPATPAPPAPAPSHPGPPSSPGALSPEQSSSKSSSTSASERQRPCGVTLEEDSPKSEKAASSGSDRFQKLSIVPSIWGGESDGTGW